VFPRPPGTCRWCNAWAKTSAGVGLGSRVLVRSYVISSVRSWTAARVSSMPCSESCRALTSSFSLLPPPNTCFLNQASCASSASIRCNSSGCSASFCSGVTTCDVTYDTRRRERRLHLVTGFQRAVFEFHATDQQRQRFGGQRELLPVVRQRRPGGVATLRGVWRRPTPPCRPRTRV
jgi:hypothetical protein